MASRRGAGGRFTKIEHMDGSVHDVVGGHSDDDLPPLVELTVDTSEPEAELLPPPPPLPAVEPGGPAGEPGSDPALSVALARALDEAIGIFFGAEFRAAPADVEAVGAAADPVLRRALVLVHADAVAETTIPAPLRELGTLVARAWVAWGDAFTLFVTEKVGELRRQREELSDGTTAGPAEAGGGGVRGDRGADGADEPGESRARSVSLADLIGPQVRAGQAAGGRPAPRLRGAAPRAARSGRR